MDKVGDDEAPDGAEEVKDEALENDEKLEHDDGRQKAPSVAARVVRARPLWGTQVGKGGGRGRGEKIQITADYRCKH